MVESEQVGTEVALTGWAEHRSDVRAMLLTSTRAVPGASVDAYSDFDVIAVVSDVESLAADTRWLAAFDQVLVEYWDPLKSDPVTGSVWVGSVVQFVSGLKIDFTLWSEQRLRDSVAAPTLLDELDAGYRVLVDKDGLTSELRPPTYTAYIPTRPVEDVFVRLVNDFFVGAPYVAKSLLRDELLPAKWVLELDMRHNYFVRLLEWRVECDHNWTWKPGALGKGLKLRLPSGLWSDFEASFAGANSSDTWDWLTRTMVLFGRVAREVAASLGFTYPQDLEDRVTEHVRRMGDGVFADGPVPDYN